MSEQTASRTLVKSPPELWAALSDPESLAQHLGEFGEIRITRLEAESNVAWEGERARGTIELSPTAWGTRVTLTAVPAEPAAAPVAPARAPAPAPVAVTPAAPPAPTPSAQASRGGGLLDRLKRVLTGSSRPPAPVRAAGPAPPLAAPPAPVAPAPPDIVAPTALAPDRTLAVLKSTLDALGAAHHRPFSRD